MWGQTETAVRFTHLPTGLSARSNLARGRSYFGMTPKAEMFRQARMMLAAMVAMRSADPSWQDGCHPGRELVRSYHLHPRLGLAPFARDERSKVSREIGEPARWSPIGPAVMDRLMLDRRRAMAADPV